MLNTCHRSYDAATICFSKKKSEEQQTLYFIVFILHKFVFLSTVDFSFGVNVKFIFKNICNKGIDDGVCEGKWAGRHVDNIFFFLFKLVAYFVTPKLHRMFPLISECAFIKQK